VGSTVHRIVSRETYSTDPKLKKSKITRDLDGSTIRSIKPCRHHPSRTHVVERPTWYSDTLILQSRTARSSSDCDEPFKYRPLSFQHFNIDAPYHTPQKRLPTQFNQPPSGQSSIPNKLPSPYDRQVVTVRAASPYRAV
jgi:hypothetical protein